MRADTRERARPYRLYTGVLAAALLAYPLLMPATTARLDPFLVVINVGVAVLLVLWAVKVAGLEPAELGLATNTLGRSLLLGGAVGLLAPAIALGLAHWPTFRQIPWWGEWGLAPQLLLYRVAFRIPLGTALFEEVAFRGVLMGMLLRQGRGTALWLSSALFGLYHVGLTTRLVASSRLGLSPVEVMGVVAGAALFTSLMGLIFGAVRVRSGNVAGSIVVHWMADACASLLVYAVA